MDGPLEMMRGVSIDESSESFAFVSRELKRRMNGFARRIDEKVLEALFSFVSLSE